MSSEGSIPEKWENAFRPYEEIINEFAEEHGLRIGKWLGYKPCWHIGKSETEREVPDDVSIISWIIIILFEEETENLSVNLDMWVEEEGEYEGAWQCSNIREHDLGFVPAFKGSDRKCRKLRKLLEEAFQIAQRTQKKTL